MEVVFAHPGLGYQITDIINTDECPLNQEGLSKVYQKITANPDVDKIWITLPLKDEAYILLKERNMLMQ